MGVFQWITQTTSRPRPRVRLHCGGRAVSTAARVVAGADGGVSFDGEVLRLSVPTLLKKDTVFTLDVLDTKSLGLVGQVHSMIGGNPRIGSVKFKLEDADLGEARERVLELKRGGKVQGQLKVIVSAVASDRDVQVLRQTKDHSLSVVATALANVLSMPHGLSLAMKSRPSSFHEMAPSPEVRSAVKRWIERMRTFCKEWETGDDAAAVRHWGSQMRSAKQIVGLCAGGEKSGQEIEDLTREWMMSLVQACYNPDLDGSPPDFDFDRVDQLLRAAQRAPPVDETPEQRLQALGADVQSRELSPETLFAIERRLAMCLQDEEEDMIALDTFFNDEGHLAFTVAAVVLTGGDRTHVFVYKWEEFQRWRQVRGTNPGTGTRLSDELIVKIEPRRAGV
eukprot:SRR837773.6075.p1 GENE.SRR837773.6075~~SRR837773.6075.p1  ORF type:complete len:423 (-),score=75.58 SRR837773.6075:65-1246(-)